MHMHTCTDTYMHTCIHAYMHTCIHAYKQTNKHTYIHTYIHTHRHRHRHTHMHAYIHTYMSSYLRFMFQCMQRCSQCNYHAIPNGTPISPHMRIHGHTSTLFKGVLKDFLGHPQQVEMSTCQTVSKSRFCIRMWVWNSNFPCHLASYQSIDLI